MSEDKPVSQSEFKQVLDQMGKTFTDSMASLTVQFEDIVSKKINANTIEVSKVLEEHAQAINALNARGQTTVGTNTRKEQLTELIELAKSAGDIPWLKEKLGIGSNPATEKLDQLGQTVALGIQRRSIKALEKIALKQFKSGDLFADEIQSVVDTKIEHGI